MESVAARPVRVTFNVRPEVRMDDEAAFLRAITESPGDDTPRLVFADWLDERGDPRSEWLRIQVHLARLAASGSWDPELVDRRRRLEADIDPAWLRAARRPPDGTGIRSWHELYDSFVIEPTYGEAARKPTAAQLDQFEADTGFRLPRSYREYILVFGPGRLFSDWYIAAPGYGDSWRWDLRTMHENVRPQEHWIDYYPAAEHDRVRRCRYFCAKYKDAFGWDPAEVCDPEAPEYAVYRLVEGGQVVRVADSFRGFMEDAMLEILTAPGWDEEELGPRLLFEPAARPTEPRATADPARE